MEEVQNLITERILNLTLEIICLLTGESCPLLKSGGQVTITVPPPHSLKRAKKYDKKILEIAQRIIGLLTGENGNLAEHNIAVKEVIKDEYGGLLCGGHDDLYKEVMMEPPRDPPERSSQHPAQGDQTSPHQDQGEDLITIKVEDDVEETYDQQYTEGVGMTRILKEEDNSAEISTEPAMENPVKNLLNVFTVCKMEDVEVTRGCHSMDKPLNPSDSDRPRTARDGSGIQGEETSSFPDCGESLSVHPVVDKLHFCPKCGKCCSQGSEHARHQISDLKEKAHLSRHQRLNIREKPYSCSECGKCYPRKSGLVTHLKSHTGERPFPCPVCGQCYSLKSTLVRHQKLHTGEKPFSCSECGKCFLEKAYLFRHLRIHRGEKPYSCLECGKYFRWQSELAAHQRCHTGEKPYSCQECGKCFAGSSNLQRHKKTHR